VQRQVFAEPITPVGHVRTGGDVAAHLPVDVVDADDLIVYLYGSFTDRHACLVALYSDLAQEMSTATTAAIADATAGVGAAPVDEITSRALGAFVEFLTADPRRARVVLIQVVGVSQRLTAVGLVGAVNHLLVNWLMTGQRDYPAVLAEVCSSLFSAVSMLSRDCTRSPPTGADRDSQPRRNP